MHRLVFLSVACSVLYLGAVASPPTCTCTCPTGDACPAKCESCDELKPPCTCWLVGCRVQCTVGQRSECKSGYMASSCSYRTGNCALTNQPYNYDEKCERQGCPAATTATCTSCAPGYENPPACNAAPTSSPTTTLSPTTNPTSSPTTDSPTRAPSLQQPPTLATPATTEPLPLGCAQNVTFHPGSASPYSDGYNSPPLLLLPAFTACATENGTLGVLPPPVGLGEIVSSVVDITCTSSSSSSSPDADTAAVCPVSGGGGGDASAGNQVTFSFPWPAASQEEVKTRLARAGDSGLQCTSLRLQCEFWDQERELWSGEGCRLNNDPLSDTAQQAPNAAPSCTCDHLTVFALILRPRRSSSATCAVRAHSVALAFLYGLTFFAACAQIARLARAWPPKTSKRRGGGTCNEADRGLRLLMVRLGAVAAICLARLPVLLLSNAVPPTVTVLAFMAATAGTAGTFAWQAHSWAHVAFSMQAAAQRRLGACFKLSLPLFLLPTLLFPVLIAAAGGDREAAAKWARAGGYVVGALTIGFSLVLGAAGAALARALHRTTTSSSSSSAAQGGVAGRMQRLKRRVVASVVVFASSFFLQGLAYILTVGDNALNDEVLDVAYPVLFHCSDAAALATLLLLSSFSVTQHAIARSKAALPAITRTATASSGKARGTEHSKHTTSSTTTELGRLASAERNSPSIVTSQ